MQAPHIRSPWQIGRLLAAPVRKLLHDPVRIVAPYLAEGMTAMDVGCGMGFFTLPMSAAVGARGQVIAIDLQPEMLAGMTEKAARANAQNITAHRCALNSLCVEPWRDAVDFALLFWVLHEIPDPDRLIRELHEALAPGGRLLFAEPTPEVGAAEFEESLNRITAAGFTQQGTPKFALSRACILQKIEVSTE